MLRSRAIVLGCGAANGAARPLQEPVPQGTGTGAGGCLTVPGGASRRRARARAHRCAGACGTNPAWHKS